MTRDEAIARIKPHEAELRAAGMDALYLFGSTARNDARSDSDVDLSCDIATTAPVGLLEFINLQERLSRILRAEVDLVERQALYPRVARHAAADMVRVF
jgi:predicted nucleotidyltransferase